MIKKKKTQEYLKNSYDYDDDDDDDVLFFKFDILIFIRHYDFYLFFFVLF